MTAQTRLAVLLAGVFLCGPLFFTVAGFTAVAPVGWLSFVLVAAAGLALVRDRAAIACLLYMLGFDVGSFGYSWWLGRDSWVLLGLFAPLVLALPLLRGYPPAARIGVTVSRVVVLVIGSQMPAESMLTPPPSETLLSVIRAGSVVMCSSVVSLSLLSFDGIARAREQALSGAAEQLRKLVAKQARTEKKLHLSVWEADRADRGRTAFLGAVSHELRTPLAMLLGLTEAMLEEAEARGDVGLQGDLEEMMIAERRLYNAVESLLQVASSDASAKPSAKATVPADRLLGDIGQGFSDKASERGIELVLQPIPGDVVLDRNRTSRVLRELIDNAIQHAVHTVRVTMERVTRDGADRGVIRFVVADDGPGLARLPASESGDSGLHVGASSATLRPPKGIGLLLARRLARQMGGSLTLDSGRPSGTRITVLVPEGLTEKQRVLVVDDMQVNGEVLLRRLDELGVEGRWVGSGAEALDVLRAGQRFDFALLDLHMPEMGGIELATRMRDLGAPCPDRLAAVTSDTSEETRAKCHAVGLDEILFKPVAVEELQRILRAPQLSHPGLRPIVETGHLDSSVLSTLATELQDPEFVHEMVTWFADSARTRIAEGRKACDLRDAETMHRAAHSLKGLAGTVGALRLQLVASDLELQSQRDVAGANAGWSEAEQELAAVLDELAGMDLEATA